MNDRKGTDMSTQITIEHAVKRYGDKTIIPDLSLAIRGGEFFTLLGPSGCGKTTLLRMIAGFNSIEGGTISFDDKVINDLPPYRRNIGMVFQNYAIFPHMSVRKNVEYGLRQRSLPKAEITARAEEMMNVVKIREYAEKAPNQLSGGQQQRVALARAIVIHPTVLLMDEPLSNLDAKLRIEMRGAIRDIQKEVGITTVYVTHDQEEALAVSDRIAVMNFGELQQVGTPVELYHRPANLFVATFVGASTIFDAVASVRGGETEILIDGKLRLPMNGLDSSVSDGQRLKVSIRPEEFELSRGEGPWQGTVKSSVFLGRFVNYEIVLPGGAVTEVSLPTSGMQDHFRPGETVSMTADASRINVFDEGGLRNLVKEREI